MLTSMLLSQEVAFEGDVEDFVQQMTRHRSPVRRPPLPATAAPGGCWHSPPLAPDVPADRIRWLWVRQPERRSKISFNDFVDLYNWCAAPPSPWLEGCRLRLGRLWRGSPGRGWACLHVPGQTARECAPVYP